MFSYYYKDLKFFYALIPHFQPRVFYDKNAILNLNEKVEDVYFVILGKVSVGINHNGRYESLICYEENIVLGDYYVLNNERCRYDCVAYDTVETLLVPGNAFKTILENFFPRLKTNIKGISIKRMYLLKKLYIQYIKYNNEYFLIDSKSFKTEKKSSLKKPVISDSEINNKIESLKNSSSRLLDSLKFSKHLMKTVAVSREKALNANF